MNHLLLPSPLPLLLHRPSSSKPLLLHTLHRRHFTPKAAPDGNSGDSPTAAAPEPSTGAPPPSAAAPSSSKPTSVKDRLRSRNQSRRVQDAYLPPVEVRMMKGREKRNDSAAPRREKPQQRRRKEWDEMSLGEKALELYVGEKGALFWLNKFAYASIFIMAGAWILFRFVGPATGLYQLDAPPLAPTDVLRGS